MLLRHTHNLQLFITKRRRTAEASNVQEIDHRRPPASVGSMADALPKFGESYRAAARTELGRGGLSKPSCAQWPSLFLRSL